VSLSLFYPELAVGLLFCALSVAASRILLGMHFLSDVLAGAAIGTTLAFGAVWLGARRESGEEPLIKRAAPPNNPQSGR
jgi:membrane-associated phospholipid phosphatase